MCPCGWNKPLPWGKMLEESPTCTINNIFSKKDINLLFRKVVLTPIISPFIVLKEATDCWANISLPVCPVIFLKRFVSSVYKGCADPCF